MAARILFLCGSPRRGKSASLLAARYLAKFLDSDHRFIDVAKAKLSADPSEADAGFEMVVTAMDEADAVVWTFGAWSWFVPVHLHRLLDKLFTQPGHDFSGKLAAAVMTSGGVGDDFALERVRFVSEQLGFAYLGDVSAEASPFMGPIGDEALTEQALRVLAGRMDRALASGYRPARFHAPVERRLLSSAHPGEGFAPEQSAPVEPSEAGGDKTIVALLGGRLESNPAARDLVDAFRRGSRNGIEVLELGEHEIKPCVGCYLCGTRPEGVCVLKDDYAAVRQRLERADGLVYIAASATGLIDPALKAFMDRGWDLAHRPRWQAKHAVVAAAGGGDLDRYATGILDNVVSKTGARIVASLPRSTADPTAYAATVRQAVEDLDRAMDEGWSHPDRFQVRASGWAFRDLAASKGMIMRADYAYHRDRGLFDAPGPGGWNAVMRLLFSSEKLEKAMLEKARAQRDQGRADRLQRYVDEGGRLGEGEEVE